MRNPILLAEPEKDTDALQRCPIRGKHFGHPKGAGCPVAVDAICESTSTVDPELVPRAGPSHRTLDRSTAPERVK